MFMQVTKIVLSTVEITAKKAVHIAKLVMACDNVSVPAHFGTLIDREIIRNLQEGRLKKD